MMLSAMQPRRRSTYYVRPWTGTSGHSAWPQIALNTLEREEKSPINKIVHKQFGTVFKKSVNMLENLCALNPASPSYWLHLPLLFTWTKPSSRCGRLGFGKLTGASSGFSNWSFLPHANHQHEHSQGLSPESPGPQSLSSSRVPGEK